MPVSTGHGSGAIRMYFYNTMQRTCEEFVYSGIGGNKNRFRNKNDCLKACHKGTRDKMPFVQEPLTNHFISIVPLLI